MSNNHPSSQAGFTLLEVMMATFVLTGGVLGTAIVLGTGMQRLASSPSDVIVKQKATQAVEAVFSARDSHKIAWSKIRNVNGGTGSDGGVFLDGPQSLHTAGPDGLVNTADDDSAIETIVLPGNDGVIGTADDQKIVLSGFTREISIRDVANENGALRSITVTLKYQSGKETRTYTLSSFISSYS